MAGNNTIKRNMLFNTAGSAVYFACQWFLIILIVRMADYAEAGVFSLATSITASPVFIALYGMRNYQVSDINGEYSNATYFISRILSSILAFLVCLAMVFAGGYDLYKSTAVLLYMVFKIVEAFADYYYGLEQRADRLDRSGVSLAIRGAGTLLYFWLSYYALRNLFISLAGMCLISALVLVIYDLPFTRAKCGNIKNKTNRNDVKKLMVACFPLALAAYLNNLSVMIPRLFLERYYGSEMLGFYSSVASPTSVVHLLATSMFAPLITTLTISYSNGDKKSFLNTIRKFLCAALIVAVVGVVLAMIFGKWVLVLLFNKEIEAYAYLFVPVIIMTELLAMNTCLFSICTVMRVMKEQYVRGILGVISSFAASFLLVKKYEAMGVVYASVLAIVVQMILQTKAIIDRIKKIDTSAGQP